MVPKLKIRCGWCGETDEYEDIAYNYQGNVKCQKCNQLFWIRVNGGELIEVRENPPK